MTLHKGEKKETEMAASPGPSETGGQANGLESPASPKSPTGSGSSVRKQLPSIPDSDTQLTLANRMIDKKLSSPKGSHTYGPFFLEYSLLAEYNQLQKQKLPGVYVIPSAKSPLLWLGVLFIRQGLYQEGVFRFSLHIPDNYPDGDCPRLIFEQPIFHPVIDPESGELDVKRAYQKWRRNVNHIWQVLLYARRVFYKIDTKNPLNPQAAVLYEQDLDLYKSRVSETVKKCKETMYDPPVSDDPHAIRFSEWDSEVHSEARSEILEPKEKSPSDGSKSAQTSGLSWMKEGTNQIFSEEDSASL